jgi:hypothetical protein
MDLGLTTPSWIASRRRGLIGGLVCLCGMLIFAFSIPQVFAAPVKKIDGYGGYKFGMTVEQALRVNPAARLTDCDDSDATACLVYTTAISAFSASVTVQFAGTTARVSKILVTIDTAENAQAHSCLNVGQEILKLLVDTYGASSRVEGCETTWVSPEGGSVSLLSLCVGSRGVNVLGYSPYKVSLSSN